jgi:3-oxoadipate enol-lactonase
VPYADTSDGVRLYFEASGSGTPIIFLHEFAAHYASWEPQVRHFSRTHRCITYSARGYPPSQVPAAEHAYTYEHFRDDAIAVLDHLRIEAAHFVGLSMGAYSSLQVGLKAPSRVLSLTLAGVGSGFEPSRVEAFHQECRERAEKFERDGPAAIAKIIGMGPGRIPFLLKDPSGFRRFYDAIAQHDAMGSAFTMRAFQGSRPPIWEFEKEIMHMAVPTLIVIGDEDDACIEPSLYLKRTIPASGLVTFPKTGHTLNLEEPALFNEAVERFVMKIEEGRWPPRDPRSRRV